MGKQRNTNAYDVVIAGGGMIGTSMALALAPLGLKVAMVEAVARQGATQPSFDDRSTALSRSTQRMLEAMGLWEPVRAAATPIYRIHVSDKGRFGFSHIDATEQRVEALGYVVINRVLGEVLQTALAGEASVDVLCPARIAAVDPAEETVAVRVEPAEGKAQELQCQLLVVADGANSGVRDMLGIAASRVAYRQHAVIGNLQPEKPIANTAYERFTETGPLALLPVADGRAGFIWTVAEEAAERIIELDDAAFVSKLQAEFGYRLGAFSRVGKRARYPLMLSKASRLTAARSVLIGNAAHGLHPVAAQGFNLGMRDVAALCDCIADARRDGADIGSRTLLQAFARWRKPDQDKLVRFTDGLVRLFGSKRRLLRWSRGAGMLAFDFIPGVRSEFARHTMGLAGRLPRLSRGVPLK